MAEDTENQSFTDAFRLLSEIFKNLSLKFHKQPPRPSAVVIGKNTVSVFFDELTIFELLLISGVFKAAKDTLTKEKGFGKYPEEMALIEQTRISEAIHLQEGFYVPDPQNAVEVVKLIEEQAKNLTAVRWTAVFVVNTHETCVALWNQIIQILFQGEHTTRPGA